MKDFTEGRHLVWDASNENTICGLRIGLVVWHQLERTKIHWSKARKTDCPVCRAEVRKDIRMRRDPVRIVKSGTGHVVEIYT